MQYITLLPEDTTEGFDGQTNTVKIVLVDCFWNVIAHAQKPDFVSRPNGRVHLIGRGVSSVDYWQPRYAHQR